MTAPDKQPLIVLFVEDLMFGVRIEQAAAAAGIRSWTAGSAAMFGEAPAEEASERPGEPLQGPAGAMFQEIAARQPALLIFDLGNRSIPWAKWIPLLKSSAATRRIPILCFGPHVEEEWLARAQNAGADAVMPRSRFASRMPHLLRDMVRLPDGAAIDAACAEALSPQAEEGIAAFNRGDYYQAHEDLEAAWMKDKGPGRDLYRAILQVAVAYYQVERGNFRGAMKMLLRVRQWLAPLPAVCRGVDVDFLRQDVERVQETLTALGAERVQEVDKALFRPVRLVNP